LAKGILEEFTMFKNLKIKSLLLLAVLSVGQATLSCNRRDRDNRQPNYGKIIAYTAIAAGTVYGAYRLGQTIERYGPGLQLSYDAYSYYNSTSEYLGSLRDTAYSYLGY